MMSGLTRIDWHDITEAAPVVVVTLLMPLTFSIAHGIAIGFIAYAVIKLITGKAMSVSSSVWVLAILFAVKFALHF